MSRSNHETAAPTAARNAPPVSRTLRFLVGAWLVFVVVTNASGAVRHLAVGIGAAFVSLLLLYVVLHLLLARSRLPTALGVSIAIAPVAVLYFLGGDAVKLGVLGFFGVSLLVAFVRGDRGCEVTTIPTLLLRRPAYLPCLLFSPLDRFEESLGRHFRGSI